MRDSDPSHNLLKCASVEHLHQVYLDRPGCLDVPTANYAGMFWLICAFFRWLRLWTLRWANSTFQIPPKATRPVVAHSLRRVSRTNDWKLRNQVGAKRFLLPQQHWLPICTCKTLDLSQRGHPCEDNRNQLWFFHTRLQTCARFGYSCTFGPGPRWHGAAAVCTL